MGAFTLTASAETYGYYTYIVTDGKATITDVNESISGDITIPDILDIYPVTSIGYGAFKNCSELTSVVIPFGVTSIERIAFEHCRSLTSVNIPNSVISIGRQAFHDCESLYSIIIPNSVTSIGSEAFSNCEDLTSVKISDRVTSIGDYTFFYCSNLKALFGPTNRNKMLIYEMVRDRLD